MGIGDKDLSQSAGEALGKHPLGTTVGAAAGGIAAGAAAGTVAGPIGTAVGAVVGAVAGGLAGKGVAERVDPDAHDAYWRENFSKRPYVAPDATYDDYAPAYRHGLDAAGRHDNKSFDEVEPAVRDEWHRVRGESKLGWDSAKHAVRDAWEWVKTDIDHD